MSPDLNDRTNQIILGGIIIVAILAIGWLITGRAKTPQDLTITPPADAAGKETDTTAPVSQQQAAQTASSGTKQAIMTGAQGESVAVNDQLAGSTVQIASMHLTRESWVAVRDSRDWILGARRFSPGTSSGSVELLRATEPGQTYTAVVYVDDGDRAFDLHVDALVEGVSDSFIAQ